MKGNKRNILTGSLEIITACLIWGYGFVITKNSLDTIALDNLMTIRYLLAAAAMSCIFCRRMTLTTGKTLLYGAAMGLLLFISQYCQTAALGDPQTTAGQVAFITALYVVLVPLLHSAGQRRLPAPLSLLAAGLAVSGLFLLVQGGIGFSRGCRTAMLGSFFFSLHILVIDRGTETENPVLLTVWQFIWAAAFAAILQAVHQVPLPGAAELPSVWLPLVYLGIFSTMLGFLMQTAGQKRLSPELASILLATEAIFGMVFSVALTGELLSAGKILGCALMLTGVLLAELMPEKN